MKCLTYLLGAAAAAVAVLAVSVVATSPASPCPVATLRAEQMRALDLFFNVRLDANKDGVCDKKEYQTYMEWMDHDDVPSLPFPLLADRFAELDGDASGSLTLPELCVALRICRPADIVAPATTSQIAGAHARSSNFERTIATAVTTPVQVHLQLTVDFQAMLVSWAQATSAPAAVQWDVVSRAGSGSGSYANDMVASVSNYSVVESGMSYTSLPLLTAVMAPLVASEQYFYRVGNDAQGWSPEFSFVAMPDPSIKEGTGAVAKIIVVGDMGTAIPMGTTVCQWIEAELAAEKAYNLTLHVGDLAYAGVNSHGEWEPTWDAWMGQIAPIASQMPYVTPVGNHEQYYNYTSFNHRLTMPSEGSKGLGNFWFSFDFESIHFASISTENVTTPGTEMYEWLVADLAAAAARPNPPVWMVLLCHRPLYSSDVSEYSTHAPGSKFLTDLEPVLQKFGVQLVLTGHMHMYERSFPVINGTVIPSADSFYTIQPAAAAAASEEEEQQLLCATSIQHDPSAPLHVFAEPNAPTYVVQGTAGAMQFESLVTPAPAWSAFRLVGTYGFGTLQLSTSASGCSTLLYQFLGGANRTVVDQFVLQKQL